MDHASEMGLHPKIIKNTYKSILLPQTQHKQAGEKIDTDCLLIEFIDGSRTLRITNDKGTAI